MSKAGLAGWAVALVLALVIVTGIASGDDATEERAAREAAEERARVADDSLAKMWKAWRADSLEDARQDSIADAAIAEAEERARLAEASANARTERFRQTLTREQQAELDGITAFWQETVRDKEAVVQELRGKLARAHGDAADNLALALEEQGRANKWKTAHEKAEAEIDALRRPNLLPDIGDIPALAITAAAVLLIAR